MYERNSLRSQALDLLRFPMALMVVIEHVFTTRGLQIQGTFVETSDYSIFVGVNHFIDAFIRSQSVPIFFFVSGFVFFISVDKFTRQNYKQKMKNRVKTLLIPYLIWNALAFLVIILKMLPMFTQYSSYVQVDGFSFSKVLLSSAQVIDGCLYLSNPADGVLIYLGNPISPMNGSLWFLSDLMIVSICSPIIFYLVKRIGWYAVAAFGIIWFMLGYTDLERTYLISIAFFFFSLGAYMSIKRKDLLVVFGKYFSWSMVLFPLLAILHFVAAYYFPEWCFAIKQLNIIVGLVFAYNLSAYLLQKKIARVIPSLAIASFFIYVANSLFTSGGRLLKVFFSLFSPSSDLAFVCLYTLTTIFIIVSLLIIFFLMRRYCPSILKIMIGRK